MYMERFIQPTGLAIENVSENFKSAEKYHYLYSRPLSIRAETSSGETLLNLKQEKQLLSVAAVTQKDMGHEIACKVGIYFHIIVRNMECKRTITYHSAVHPSLMVLETVNNGCILLSKYSMHYTESCKKC